MRTVEDFKAKYGYITTGMIKDFGYLCQLTETQVGQAWVQYVADKTDTPKAEILRYVLDGTLTKDFINGVQDVLKEMKQGEAA